ncbi:CRP-like cAMP-binding protein [Lachnospiraceae bacterium PF1-21]
MNYIETIMSLSLFSSIDKETFQRLDIVQRCRQKSYRKESIIHLQNELCQSIDVIISGIVTVQNVEESGNLMTITNFSSGEILGSNLLFSSHPVYPMTVMAKTDVALLCFHKEMILDLCTASPAFLETYLQEISNKTLVLTGKINTIALKSIRECIIEYLMLERSYQNSNTITLPFSKKEWAELLGIQRPSLSRELNKMRRDGLIDFHNREIQILNL